MDKKIIKSIIVRQQEFVCNVDFVKNNAGFLTESGGLFQVVVLCKSKIKPNLNNITNQN